MKKHALILSLSILSLEFAAGFALAAPVAPQKYVVGTGAEANFSATGKPSLLKIKGQGAKISGNVAFENGDAHGTFELALNEFDTGIELRNQHMKEKYLETGKFPKAVLEVTHVALPKDFSPGKDLANAVFKGTLTLKGVSKPVEGTLSFSGAKMSTTADFSFSLNDYPVGVPSYLGVTVADRVQVQAKLPELARK